MERTNILRSVSCLSWDILRSHWGPHPDEEDFISILLRKGRQFTWPQIICVLQYKNNEMHFSVICMHVNNNQKKILKMHNMIRGTKWGMELHKINTHACNLIISIQTCGNKHNNITTHNILHLLIFLQCKLSILKYSRLCRGKFELIYPPCLPHQQESTPILSIFYNMEHLK